uniref:Uncharacterized protein n=1 Tax=Sphaerodactylus townsendi TaxID=933632 RepID=A0ACB8ER88_9SAUR
MVENIGNGGCLTRQLGCRFSGCGWQQALDLSSAIHDEVPLEGGGWDSRERLPLVASSSSLPTLTRSPIPMVPPQEEIAQGRGFLVDAARSLIGSRPAFVGQPANIIPWSGASVSGRATLGASEASSADSELHEKVNLMGVLGSPGKADSSASIHGVSSSGDMPGPGWEMAVTALSEDTLCQPKGHGHVSCRSSGILEALSIEPEHNGRVGPVGDFVGGAAGSRG